MKKHTILLICMLLVCAGCGQREEGASQDKVSELMSLTKADKFVQIGFDISEHPDDPHREIKQEFRQELDKQKLIKLYSAVYAKHFSDDELDDLIRFYRTDTGKKIVRVMPDVMMEIVEVSQSVTEETIARLENKEGSLFRQKKQDTDALICRNNLRMIDAAKEMAALELELSNGSSVTEDQISGYIKDGASSLECPSCGTYGIGPIGESPTCTVTSHALPKLSFALPGLSPVTPPAEKNTPEEIIKEFCAEWRMPLASIEKTDDVFRVHLKDGRTIQLNPSDTTANALHETLQRVGCILSSPQGKKVRMIDARDSDSIIGHNNAPSGDHASETIPAIYVIQPGDTLSGIARKLETSISEIKKLNNLDTNDIRAGDTLTLPRQ
ncbi:MAG: DUF2059 domain-containing protein [Kiritimatiellae bacterium]|nr:DUF2059 domain-containing protein [Kiritimatiellia bacterium]